MARTEILVGGQNKDFGAVSHSDLTRSLPNRPMNYVYTFSDCVE